MRTPAATAILRAKHFEFVLGFEMINSGTNELHTLGDVWVSLRLQKPRNITFETETYMRGDQLHVLRTVVRDTLKLNGSVLPCTGEYSPEGQGFAIELTAIKQWYGDPKKLPALPDSMPCTCGVSFATGPAEPELGGFIKVASSATTGAVQEFLDGLDRAAGKREALVERQ